MGHDREPSAAAIALRVYWLPGLVFLVHLILLSGPDYYKVFEVADELMHPLGGFALAYAAAQALDVLQAAGAVPRLGPRLRGVLVFSLTATATVLWELGEFLCDHYLRLRMLGDVEDTLSDMALGLGGGLAYLALEALTAPGTSRRARRMLGGALLSAGVVGPALVWRGELEQTFAVLLVALYAGLPLGLAGLLLLLAARAPGRARRVGAGLAWLAACCLAALGSLPLGAALAASDVRAARRYWEARVPELEAFRRETGAYPEGEGQLDSWEPGAAPRLSGGYSRSADGQGYTITIWDPRELFAWHEYDSGTGAWRELRD